MAALVEQHKVDNTVVVTLSNLGQSHFTENWVYHLRSLGVGGLLVGVMNVQPSDRKYYRLATKLRALGVTHVYCVGIAFDYCVAASALHEACETTRIQNYIM